jgi:hypothetical protein
MQVHNGLDEGLDGKFKQKTYPHRLDRKQAEGKYHL